MLDLKNIIENIFLNKKTEIQKEYEEKLSKVENEKKVVSFILNDLSKSVVFGEKDKGKIKYETKKLLKKLDIKENSFLWGTDCVDTLKGLGFRVEKSISPDCIIINKPNY
jgi:hypothetical protein